MHRTLHISVFPAADVTRPGFLEPSPGRSAWDPWLPGVTRAASSGPRAPPPRVCIIASSFIPAVRLRTLELLIPALSHLIVTPGGLICVWCGRAQCEHVMQHLAVGQEGGLGQQVRRWCVTSRGAARSALAVAASWSWSGRAVSSRGTQHIARIVVSGAFGQRGDNAGTNHR